MNRSILDATISECSCGRMNVCVKDCMVPSGQNFVARMMKTHGRVRTTSRVVYLDEILQLNRR
jgi:hypothetical protein